MAKRKFRIEGGRYGGELVLGEVNPAFVSYYAELNDTSELIDAVLEAEDWEPKEDEDNDTLLDSVMLSGSLDGLTNQIKFQLKDQYKFNLERDIDYNLSFNAVAEKGNDGRALLIMYGSGSSFLQS